jgi:DNA-binding GntR family transcriptional regulator
MGTEAQLEKYKLVNLVEQIANFVEQEILDGTIKMGHQLVEQELSKQFKTSRQPIREAFRVLENKGLVTVVPRKGTFVATITWEDFEQFFPVIAVLDGLAGRIVYTSITEDALVELEAVLESLMMAAEEKDTRNYLLNHAEFHLILNKATRNKLLIDSLTSLRTAHSWFIMTHMKYSDEQYESSVAYHRRIIVELRDRTIGEDAMERLMREHVLNTVQFYRSYFGKNDGAVSET